VKSLPPLWHKDVWVLKTVSGLPTSKVYGQLQLESSSHAVDSEQPLKSFLEGPSIPFNDLEIAAFALLPELAMLKKDLLALGFEEVWLAGSGSSMLCIAPTGAPLSTLPVKFEGFSRLCRAIYRPANGWY
jgi:4-diphosphocytidyl-2C-methyl-D-erythritol kinase